MVNEVILIGRLGSDPEVRTTSSGTEVANVNLATERRFKNNHTGEWSTETEWVPLVFWAKLAGIVARFLRKGSKIYVRGRLQTRSWEDRQTGQTRYKTEVVVNDMRMLDDKKRDDGAGYSGGRERRDETLDSRHRPMDEPDDDIPF